MTNGENRPQTAQYSFSDADLAKLSEHDIDLDEAEKQLNLLLSPAFYSILERPATINDGIFKIDERNHKFLLSLHAQAATSGRFIKFVPASGAASRMFRDLLFVLEQEPNLDLNALNTLCQSGIKEASVVKQFIEKLTQFAFYNSLSSALKAHGKSLEALQSSANIKPIIEALIGEDGLNYAQLPKGLLEFHLYKDGARTAFEEHLQEAAHTVSDKDHLCRLHFTISAEHLQKFQIALGKILSKLESSLKTKFKVDFSHQKPATDMLALGSDRLPFHDEHGNLLLRPGGHGALIENLNDLQGDLIYIKNIDNVQTDKDKPEVILYKKLLAGVLVDIQEKLFARLKRLHSSDLKDSELDEIVDFSRNNLCIAIADSTWSELATHQRRRDFLIRKLNRPLRVCGVVKNTGEPGGGPFWVRGDGNTLSLQIVEGAQVNPALTDQSKIFASSTHFNPVDMVCAVRNFRGQNFDLRNFVDSRAIILTQKSYQGKVLVAGERPGLWNGSMADWNTLFVELPVETFTPVKTVIDLLRPAHQA